MLSGVNNLRSSTMLSVAPGIIQKKKCILISKELLRNVKGYICLIKLLVLANSFSIRIQ